MSEPIDTPAPTPPVLSMTAISKRFGAVQALTGVNLDIHPHEVVAVVGDNGAGKSTLAKIIAGVYTPDAGEVVFDGRPVSISSPSAAVGMGIATVFQDLALCDNLDVVANLFLGRELRGALAMDEAGMENVARGIFHRLTSKLPSVRQKVAGLSGGQRQTVAVARALLGKPKVVVLDEPTAALSVAQTAEVLNLILRLRELDHGVMLISHNLVDVQSVADRIVVLRHGRNNGTFNTSDVRYEDIIAAITGAKVDLSTPLSAPRRTPAPTRPRPTEQVATEIRTQLARAGETGVPPGSGEEPSGDGVPRPAADGARGPAADGAGHPGTLSSGRPGTRPSPPVMSRPPTGPLPQES